MDRRLGLGIVPRTEIVSLASPVFSYPPKDRWAYRRGNPLPPKLGSFQLFVKGYTDASTFFYQGYGQLKSLHSPSSPTSSESSPLRVVPASSSSATLTSQDNNLDSTPTSWSEEAKTLFRLNFERMVILDYLIRQTDRGMDNWMIKYLPQKHLQKQSEQGNQEHGKSLSKLTLVTSNHPLVSLAAIDNGLAFPFKHPDYIRSYPYGWTYLPLAQIPFSSETGQQVLTYLTSQSWWEDTIHGLHTLFSIDRDFEVWNSYSGIF
jgi:hypothetical protein